MLVNPLCPDISQTYSLPVPSVPCDPDSQSWLTHCVLIFLKLILHQYQMSRVILTLKCWLTHCVLISLPVPSVACDPDSQMLVNPLCPDISQTYSLPVPSVPCDPDSQSWLTHCVLIFLKLILHQYQMSRVILTLKCWLTHCVLISLPVPSVPSDPDSQMLVNPLCPDISTSTKCPV